MKNKIKLIGLLATVLSLSACHYDVGLGNHDNDYLKDDQSLPLLTVPADLHMDTQAMNKTSLPAFNQQEAETSIYPPNILGEEKTARPVLQQPQQTQSRQAPVIRTVQTLTINADLKHSWVKVGTALKKSGYRIVDQDLATHSFYVLDVRGKGRALKEASPIYCVQLREKTAKLTQVNVLAQNKQPAPPAVTADILNNMSSKLR